MREAPNASLVDMLWLSLEWRDGGVCGMSLWTLKRSIIEMWAAGQGGGLWPPLSGESSTVPGTEQTSQQYVDRMSDWKDHVTQVYPSWLYWHLHWIILCCGAVLCSVVCSGLDTRRPPTPIVTTQNVARHCHVSPERQNSQTLSHVPWGTKFLDIVTCALRNQILAPSLPFSPTQWRTTHLNYGMH